MGRNQFAHSRGGAVPFSPSLPDVTSVESSRVFQSDSYFAFFVKNAKSWGEKAVRAPIITYPYTFVVSDPQIKMPVLFVTLEESVFGTKCLCIFDRGGVHRNLGPDELLDDEQAFIDRAIGLVQAEFGERLHELSPKAQAAPTKKRGIFSRLFGGEPDTRDGWRQKQEEQERQSQAAERERQRRQEERDREAIRLFNLGAAYARGDGGLPQDDRQAAHFYKLAADRGLKDAQFILGTFYESGRAGLPQDEREAARLYKLAADQGFGAAQHCVGYFYLQGRGGLPQDDRQATHFFKLAADQGVAMAQIGHGRFYAAAQFGLGRFYMEGRGGLPQDDRQAVHFYKLAADQGHFMAQFILGIFYESGRGGLPRDDHEAARLFKLAADQGFPADPLMGFSLRQEISARRL